MNKWILKLILIPTLSLLPALASAGVLQQIQIANMLYNQDATASNPGLSPTAVLVKLFTSGASTACYSTTIPYQGSITITTGTGQSCSSTVTTISFAPVASTVVGTIYNAPATVTLTSDYTQQIMISQTAKAVSTSYGPVFDTTNGVVVTPGTVTIDVQSHFVQLGQN